MVLAVLSASELSRGSEGLLAVLPSESEQKPTVQLWI